MSNTFSLLEGRLKLYRGPHNPSEDALWLSAAVTPSPGEKVLDAGCGSGIISLALSLRCPEIHLTALDEETAAINATRLNAQLNNCVLTLVQGRFEALPFSPRTFDHVIANLPFHASTRGHKSSTKARAHTLPAGKLSLWLKNLQAVSNKSLTILIHTAEEDLARTFAADHKLYLRCFYLRTQAGRLPKRLICQFSQNPPAPDEIINTFEDKNRQHVLHKGNSL